MDFVQWSQLVIICILGAMSPGPSLAVILRNSISGGRKQGILCGIGHGIGISFYALIAVFGLVTFLKKNSNFFLIIQITGSLFLIWIGYRMIYSFILNNESNKKYLGYKKTGNQGFLEGFLIAFLNPKIAAWTFALFSQFVSPNATINEQIILISTVGGIDAFWYCFVAAIATSGSIDSLLNNYAKLIDFLMGILLIFLALGMLWEVFNKI